MIDSKNHLSLNEILCILAILTLCFTGIIGHDLWTPDEPREAAISLEMAQSGDYLIPHLAGTAFVEKPPLYYIATTCMIKIFGPLTGTTAAVRLCTVFFGLGVLIATFLLGKSIGGDKTGILSAVFLGSMEGFIENFHWIRVDAALSFFVIAAVYCFHEMYRKDKYMYILPGGIFLAGSFLSKGLIGPLLIFVPWFILFIGRLFENRENKINAQRFVMSHFLLLIIFLSLCLAWIIPFYFKGGQALWHEWFWVNHVERFTGTAVVKGHVIKGKPFYYVTQLLMYGIPWTPLILYWITIKTKQMIMTRKMDKNDLFIFLWGVLTLILLTSSASKRGIYLTPLLPSFAIMSALSLSKGLPHWFKPYAILWIIFSLILITLITFSPFIAPFFSGFIPVQIYGCLSEFGYFNILSLTGLFASIFIISKYRDVFSLDSIVLFVTAFLYVTLLGSPMKAIDQMKSMDSDIRNFVSRIPEAEYNRIATTEYNETTIGCLYYYCGVKVHYIPDYARIENILKGKDPEYDCLIINRRNKNGDDTDLVKIPYRVIAKTVTGTDRALYLIKGNIEQETKNIDEAHEQSL